MKDEGAVRARFDAMTDEEFVADLVAKHGPEAARAMAKAMQLPPPKNGVKPHQAKRAGVPRKKHWRPAIPAVPAQGVNWREWERGPVAFRDDYKGPRNRSGLPRSGAPVPPRSTP